MARKSKKSKQDGGSWLGWMLDIDTLAMLIAAVVCGAFTTALAVWLFWNGEQLLISLATAGVAFVVGGLLGVLAIGAVFNS